MKVKIRIGLGRVDKYLEIFINLLKFSGSLAIQQQETVRQGVDWHMFALGGMKC